MLKNTESGNLTANQITALQELVSDRSATADAWVCKPITPKWSHTVSRLKQAWRIDDEGR